VLVGFLNKIVTSVHGYEQDIYIQFIYKRNMKRVSINSGIYTSTSLKMGHRGRDLALVLRGRIALHL